MEIAVRDLGVCPYATALALQEELVGRRVAGEITDQLLLLEHLPVYTLGRGADAEDLRGADQTLGVPVFRVGRGGGVTFHGPGQLIAYPIIRLGHGGRDVHRYVRALEDVLIGVCADFGIAAERLVALTGVWVGRAKIGSIGIGVRRWTTFHGIALNVSTDLRFFTHIIPCRMPEVRMTSMAEQLGAAPPMGAVAARFSSRFCSVFGYTQARAQEEHHP
ncbi:MAG TPA: lipoyl(octanoyl) transferase LipB [Candidatus Margulisiibacteriota bacterium]|nr:lipoyl(octanoyl) transferase LipB [Candidatus Margulisiibacteriota bacterium]